MAQIIPTFRYTDAPAAIEWLCTAFGFEKHAVYPDDNGGIAHAQLTLGGEMIMLGSVRDTPFDALQKPPTATGGVNTSSVYVVVPDPDPVYERALAAGAEVVMPNEDQEHGGRSFVVRDPEGILWCFGSYDPRA